MTFSEICNAVLKSEKANGYAKAYARAGITGNMTGHEAYVQALYILTNIDHWRGENSKEVRVALKDYIIKHKND